MNSNGGEEASREISYSSNSYLKDFYSNLLSYSETKATSIKLADELTNHNQAASNIYIYIYI
jgi:hypothetical protein